MNTELDARMSRAIKEYADAAPLTAGDVDAVLAGAAERPAVAPAPVRRRRRWLVPAAAAAAVIAVVAVAATWLPRQTGTPPARARVPQVDIDLAASAKSGSLDWLPERIDARDDAPSLPAGRAVGKAAAVYGSRSGATILVTSAGKRYRLDIPEREVLDRALRELVSISPDGRWLLYDTGDSVLVRDLTGVTEHQLQGEYGPPAWSPDGQWLAVLARTGPYLAKRPLVRMNLRTGGIEPMKTAGPSNPSGVLSGGVVLILSSFPVPDSDRMQMAEDPRRFRLTFQDERDGGGRYQEVDFSGVFTKLPPGDHEEFPPDQMLRISSDGDTAAAVFYEWRDKRLSHLAGIVTFDLATGTQPIRYNVLDPNAEPATRDRRDQVANWRFLCQLDEGLLIAHNRDGGTDLELVEVDTGERRVVSRLPAETPFVVRGS